MEQKIKALLARIVHPESGRNIVESGMVEHIDAGEGRVTVTLRFEKARDPFALKIKRQVEEAIARELSLDREHVAVIVREAAPKAAPAASQHTFTGGIGKVLAVASGKGGVGKSTVTANLALTLRNMGYRVGILDADIYGPSQPKMFGVEGYLPDAERIDGEDCILPADAMGIKLMSIGFFIKPSDALIWRDAMATNALRQMIHQTKWGGLDFLLVDLPPGTGGVHLAVISELKVTGAVIVSTPQQVAVADVRRGTSPRRQDRNSRRGHHREHGLVHPEGTPRKPLLHLRPRGCARLRRAERRAFPGRYSDRSIRYGRIGRGASGRGNRSGRRIPLSFDRRKSC